MTSWLEDIERQFCSDHWIEWLGELTGVTVYDPREVIIVQGGAIIGAIELTEEDEIRGDTLRRQKIELITIRLTPYLPAALYTSETADYGSSEDPIVYGTTDDLAAWLGLDHTVEVDAGHIAQGRWRINRIGQNDGHFVDIDCKRRHIMNIANASLGR